jgi:hypothetical protein
MTNVADDGDLRDGSSPALAIVEDQWLWRRRHCPRFTQTKQVLIRVGNKYFDRVTLCSPSDGETRVLYFELSHLEE